MRKILILILMLLLLLNIAYAGINAQHACDDFRCIEGQDMNFSVWIYNNVNRNVTIHDVYVKDFDYDKLLAMAFIDEVKIKPNETTKFVLQAPVKMPVEGRTFNYFPCMKVSLTDFPGQFEVICGDTIKAYTVIPVNEIECWTDDDCGQGECKFNRCKSSDEITGMTVCSIFQTEESGSCVSDYWLFGKIFLVLVLLIGVFVMLKKWF